MTGINVKDKWFTEIRRGQESFMRKMMGFIISSAFYSTSVRFAIFEVNWLEWASMYFTLMVSLEFVV
jgi:hypothetical protein